MLAFLKLAIAFITSLATIAFPIAPGVVGGADKFFYNWNESAVYSSEDYAVSLEKQPDKDFVVLNFTDVQLTDIEAYGKYGEIAEGTMDRLITELKPDLITLTGDNAWGALAYLKLINFVDSYGIPWAAVMGNHDGQNLVSEFWAAYRMANAKNSVFDYGPKDMGYGNYIINVTENGKTVHTLFMMDTHSNAPGGGYDQLWPNQISWYKWAVKGIAEENGGNVVQSTVFFHIPVNEYADAWAEAWDAENKTYRPEYADTSFGRNDEGVCSPRPDNRNGFFDVCRELGSTKDMIAGHDHINCSSILYKGIRLSYGYKTGSGCYSTPDMNGGSTLSIASDGTTLFEHHFVDAASIHTSSPIC